MDFAFSEDQQALRDLALQIIGDHATHERLKEIEALPEWFDRKLWTELAKADLLGIAIPEKFGGSGLGLMELCLLLEAIGRHCAPIPAWPTLVLGTLPIIPFGTSAQQQRFLPRRMGRDPEQPRHRLREPSRRRPRSEPPECHRLL